jgi:hypothetical protein
MSSHRTSLFCLLGPGPRRPPGPKNDHSPAAAPRERAGDRPPRAGPRRARVTTRAPLAPPTLPYSLCAGQRRNFRFDETSGGSALSLQAPIRHGALSPRAGRAPRAGRSNAGVGANMTPAAGYHDRGDVTRPKRRSGRVALLRVTRARPFARARTLPCPRAVTGSPRARHRACGRPRGRRGAPRPAAALAPRVRRAAVIVVRRPSCAAVGARSARSRRARAERSRGGGGGFRLGAGGRSGRALAATGPNARAGAKRSVGGGGAGV